MDCPPHWQIIPLTPEAFAEWDNFCLESSDAWFWHTIDWLQYILNYRPGLRPRLKGFFVRDQRRVLCIFPLVLETHDEESVPAGEFSFGGDPGPAPAFANDLSFKTKTLLSKIAFAHMDTVSRECGALRLSLQVSPLCNSFHDGNGQRANPLVKSGLNDISLATQILDLADDEHRLLAQMRKGHTAAIKSAAKLLDAEVFDQTNATDEAFESYQLLHHKAAGRVTRPLITFHMMHDWIRKGSAILCRARHQGNDVGFALFNVYKGNAYYSSSCEDPEHNHLPIGHLLQWTAIRWLKRHGIRWYEIGLQVYHSQPQMVVGEKEAKIAFFKRGFGGSTVPLWRGEKFYDRQYASRVLHNRVDRYTPLLDVAPDAVAGLKVTDIDK